MKSKFAGVALGVLLLLFPASVPPTAAQETPVQPAAVGIGSLVPIRYRRHS
jgi:hypothetical protein